MPSQKKLEKDAKKAIAKAKNAIDDARKLAKKAGKKPRATVEALAKDLAKAMKKAEPAPTSADVYTPPLPHAETVNAPTPQGTVEPVELATLSIIALRNLAKSKGLTGYTRLSKAALVEFLEKALAD